MQPLAPPAQVVIAHPQPARPHHKAHETGAVAAAADLGLDRMGTQTQRRQLGIQPEAGTVQGLGVIGEQGEIIHIAQVGAHTGQGAEGVIDGVEVQVGEKLTGEIADRQTARSLQRGEQGVTGEGIEGRTDRGTVGQDLIQQPERAGAGDDGRQLGPQECEINAGEIEADIRLEHPAVAGRRGGEAPQGAMAAQRA